MKGGVHQRHNWVSAPSGEWTRAKQVNNSALYHEYCSEDKGCHNSV